MSTFPFCLLPQIHLLFLSICLLALLPVSKYGRFFYVTAVRCFCFLWFETVVYFVFTFFPQSTPCSACLDFGTESWVPFSCFPCPSFFWWRCYSHRQSPFHSSVHFDRTRNLGPLIQSFCLCLLPKETSLSWSQSVSVLLPSCVSLSEFSWLSFLSQCRFSDFHVACHLFFAFSSCLYNGSKHLPFCFLYQSSVFVCHGPCSTRVAQFRREHHI